MSNESSEQAAVEPDEIPDDQAARMTFTGHLGELRDRMLRCCIMLVVLAIIGYVMSSPIVNAVKQPLEDAGLEWVTLSPLEPFLVKLKFAMYTAVVLGIPYIAWNVCGFVFPGLRPKEKRAVKIIMFGSAGLAITGVMVAFFGVFPLVLPYLVQMTPEGVTNMLRLNETLSVIIKGTMGFALAFQFPLVVFTLIYVGILEPAQLKEFRRHAIVGMFVVAMLLTPPDPISLMLMAGPLVLLYEVSIWVSYLIVRRKAEAEGE